ncbi:copper-containing nitrite reductase [Salisaeta longa]|uniref:copper-containing nitrite reductase n=1 Tax=Salisaeta longa TaxID=503170 RepID=UPI00041F22BC|nr:copper-containing nitrite reductase [Salisaeta longa]
MLQTNRRTASDRSNVSRRSFMKGLGTAAAAGGFMASGLEAFGADYAMERPDIPLGPVGRKVNRVAADPTDIPPPIRRHTSKTHDITLTSEEVVAEIEPGVTFNFMTFGGQVPGPMIRVRQGDTVNLTLTNDASNRMPHNVDFHAVYGPGGGAEATLVAPGQSRSFSFQAMYPGAFIYHCAVPNLDYHIASGMFGMIVVEPPEGLPPVDHEFYIGQHEVYTNKKTGEAGHHAFDFDAMMDEKPSYVLLNGAKYGLTPDRLGAMEANVGETARVFMVTGGPNLTSSFHPIGNVWTDVWREGAIQSAPEKNVQTTPVAPGSCGIFHMKFPVPGPVFLVDHALSRVARKGAKATINVTGPEQPDIFAAR